RRRLRASASVLDHGGRCRLDLSMLMPKAAVPALQAALQVPPARDAVSVAADVAVIVIGVAVVALAIVLVIMILQVSGTNQDVRRSVRQNIGPVSDRARSISDNV